MSTTTTLPTITLATAIARTLDALKRCQARPDQYGDAITMHEETLAGYLDQMPSGSGWDCGTKLDLDRSTPDKLVFYGSYHHMNDGGMYDGWTEHTIIVRASLAFELDVRVTGRDRNDIKSYIGEMFHDVLTATVTR